MSSKIYDKRDGFDFDIVIFPFSKVGGVLIVPLTVCIFHNLLGFIECVVVWITSMLVINV